MTTIFVALLALAFGVLFLAADYSRRAVRRMRREQMACPAAGPLDNDDDDGDDGAEDECFNPQRVNPC